MFQGLTSHTLVSYIKINTSDSFHEETVWVDTHVTLKHNNINLLQKCNQASRSIPHNNNR